MKLLFFLWKPLSGRHVYFWAFSCEIVKFISHHTVWAPQHVCKASYTIGSKHACSVIGQRFNDRCKSCGSKWNYLLNELLRRYEHHLLFVGLYKGRYSSLLNFLWIGSFPLAQCFKEVYGTVRHIEFEKMFGKTILTIS